MRINVERVRAISQVKTATYSLDTLISGEGDETLNDVLSDENFPEPSSASDERLIQSQSHKTMIYFGTGPLIQLRKVPCELVQ